MSNVESPHWPVVREIGESVVRRAYPEELDDFDEAAEWFRARPEPAGTRPPVGMGVEFAAVVPVVLSAVSLLAGAVFNSAVEGAAHYLSTATKEKLAAVFRRRAAPDALAAAGEAPAVGAEAPAGAAPDPEWLTPEQEREVYRLIRERATGPMPEDEAERLAEAVIGALRLRGTGSP